MTPNVIHLCNLKLQTFALLLDLFNIFPLNPILIKLFLNRHPLNCLLHRPKLDFHKLNIPSVPNHFNKTLIHFAINQFLLYVWPRLAY